ncbi:hypothetical protein [Streptomyces cyaneofuscatus]|uniref:hypothetical protein n=1 Tax=Streptomyces cyaneofuscatus TaxID=66883 RepID=UPI0037F1B9CC
MQHEDITPDMHVMIGDAPGVVLHTRPAPEAPESVFVLNCVNSSTTWIPAAELTERRMMPSVPSLLPAADRSALDDRVFWYGGNEYHIRPTAALRYTVERVDTGVAIVGDRPTHMNALLAAVKAERRDDAPVEYIVEARDKNANELRMTADGVDGDGRLHVATPEDGPVATLGQKTAVHRNWITGKESRRSIYQFNTYPVYADGWIGRPEQRIR